MKRVLLFLEEGKLKQIEQLEEDDRSDKIEEATIIKYFNKSYLLNVDTLDFQADPKHSEALSSLSFQDEINKVVEEKEYYCLKSGNLLYSFYF